MLNQQHLEYCINKMNSLVDEIYEYMNIEIRFGAYYDNSTFEVTLTYYKDFDNKENHRTCNSLLELAKFLDKLELEETKNATVVSHAPSNGMASK